jgi:signal transduction histidine kinase
MRRAESLQRRIVVAFVLFGAGACVIFAAIAALAVEGIEVHLVDRRLEGAYRWAAPRQAAGLDVNMPSGLDFHRDDTTPAHLRGLADGVHKIDVGDTRLHVLAGHDAGGGWVLVDHESDYDKIEVVVYSMFAAAFAGFLLLAALLGRFLGTRVVRPIRELAASVGNDIVPVRLTERRDELGVLASALQAHTAELRGFLDRERYFTGDVSHELRSPLTVIMGAAEILIEQADSPVLRAPAERIYRAANEAAQCITVLLMLARSPDLANLPPVSINTIARDAVDTHGPLVAGKPVSIRFLDGPALATRAPRELCAVMLNNLVRNACQYTNEGEITVRIVDGAVIVEDTGPGLPAEVIATLGSDGNGGDGGNGGIDGNRGNRGNAGAGRASTGSGGSGLGLALARRVCDFLDAGFTYEARREGGSRFSMIFKDVAS